MSLDSRIQLVYQLCNARNGIYASYDALLVILNYTASDLWVYLQEGEQEFLQSSPTISMLDRLFQMVACSFRHKAATLQIALHISLAFQQLLSRVSDCQFPFIFYFSPRFPMIKTFLNTADFNSQLETVTHLTLYFDIPHNKKNFMIIHYSLQFKFQFWEYSIFFTKKLVPFLTITPIISIKHITSFRAFHKP